MGAEKPGRPRAFDPVAALEKALDVFLRQGYDAASLDDLTQAMGINRPSLYAAFGSKGDLYNAALRHYAAKNTDDILQALQSAEDPVSGVQVLLRQFAEKMSGKRASCLIVSSASQCARGTESGDGAIENVTHEIMGHLTGQLEVFFATAQKQRRLKKDVSARALAHYFVGLIQGFTVLARTSGDTDAVRDVVEVACAFLERLRV